MKQWIEVNLPWRAEPVFSNLATKIYAEIYEKMHASFPLDAPFVRDYPREFDTHELLEYLEDLEEMGTTIPDTYDMTEEIVKELLEKHAHDQKLCFVIRRRWNTHQYDEWFNAEFESEKYAEKRREADALREQDKLLSFCSHPANRPGVMIELADGQRMVIGHINTLGGVCDDCTGINATDIVTRYIELELPE